nr:unnamed protein product [Spirometra erinaceieuropaei]
MRTTKQRVALILYILCFIPCGVFSCQHPPDQLFCPHYGLKKVTKNVYWLIASLLEIPRKVTEVREFPCVRGFEEVHFRTDSACITTGVIESTNSYTLTCVLHISYAVMNVTCEIPNEGLRKTSIEIYTPFIETDVSYREVSGGSDIRLSDSMRILIEGPIIFQPESLSWLPIEIKTNIIDYIGNSLTWTGLAECGKLRKALQ